jgi:hypothetical protein
VGKRGFDAFWAELSPCTHAVQIYDSDSEFLDNLAEFVAGGLVKGEAAVVIATPLHRYALHSRLAANGFDLEAAIRTNQLILLDAEETIAKFIVNDWPQDHLFHAAIGDVLKRATGGGRRVRAFGEMVAVMWAKGLCGATIKLEHLWTDLCRKLEFSLFCAYPKAGFTANDAAKDIARVCDLHSATFDSEVEEAVDGSETALRLKEAG